MCQQRVGHTPVARPGDRIESHPRRAAAPSRQSRPHSGITGGVPDCHQRRFSRGLELGVPGPDLHALHHRLLQSAVAAFLLVAVWVPVALWAMHPDPPTPVADPAGADAGSEPVPGGRAARGPGDGTGAAWGLHLGSQPGHPRCLAGRRELGRPGSQDRAFRRDVACRVPGHTHCAGGGTLSLSSVGAGTGGGSPGGTHCHAGRAGGTGLGRGRGSGTRWSGRTTRDRIHERRSAGRVEAAVERPGVLR